MGSVKENGRIRSIEWAKRIQALENIVVLDVETSGWGRGVVSEIVEVAVIDGSGETLINERIRPLRPIQRQATDVHGISNNDVKDARGFSDVWRSGLRDALDGRVVVAYNAAFEKSTLKGQLKDQNLVSESAKVKAWECAMIAFAGYYGDWNSYRASFTYKKLSVAASTFDIDLANAHSALDDALATLKVVKAMAKAD